MHNINIKIAYRINFIVKVLCIAIILFGFINPVHAQFREDDRFQTMSEGFGRYGNFYYISGPEDNPLARTNPLVEGGTIENSHFTSWEEMRNHGVLYTTAVLGYAGKYPMQPAGSRSGIYLDNRLLAYMHVNSGGAHEVTIRVTPEEANRLWIMSGLQMVGNIYDPNQGWVNRAVENNPRTKVRGVFYTTDSFFLPPTRLNAPVAEYLRVPPTGGRFALLQNPKERSNSYNSMHSYRIVVESPQPTCSLSATTPYYRNGNAYTRLVWSTTNADSASITRNGTEIGTGRNNSGREVRLVGAGANTFRLQAENGEGLCEVTRIVRPARCSDNQDNDGDGFIDEDDQGCWTDPTNPNTYDPADDSEYNPNFCPGGVAGDIRGREFGTGGYVQALTATLGADIQLRTTTNGCTRFSNIEGPGISGRIVVGAASPFATGRITPPNRVGSYTYTYTVQDVRDNRTTDTITVNVVAPVPTADIDVTEDVVNPGQTYRVNWSTTNAASVRVFKDGTEFSTAENDTRNQTARMAEVGTTITYRVIATRLGGGDPVEDTDTVRVLTQCSDNPVDNDGDGQVDREDPGCWSDPEDPSTYDPNDNSEDSEGGNDPAILDVAPNVSITANGVAERTIVRADRDFTVEWNPNGYTTPTSPAANIAGISCELSPAAVFTAAGVTEAQMMQAGSVSLRRSALTTFTYSCTSPDAVGQKAWQGGEDKSAEVSVEVTPQVFDS